MPCNITVVEGIEKLLAPQIGLYELFLYTSTDPPEALVNISGGRLRTGDWAWLVLEYGWHSSKQASLGWEVAHAPTGIIFHAEKVPENGALDYVAQLGFQPNTRFDMVADNPRLLARAALDTMRALRAHCQHVALVNSSHTKAHVAVDKTYLHVAEDRYRNGRFP